MSLNNQEYIFLLRSVKNDLIENLHCAKDSPRVFGLDCLIKQLEQPTIQIESEGLPQNTIVKICGIVLPRVFSVEIEKIGCTDAVRANIGVLMSGECDGIKTVSVKSDY
jgi:hypothetical protein